ncbi:MAG: sel1 repeat family protein [Paludibacteraceae bacterium]|nr:sel1 repeat family protein [Paludibacteraceae bacterium]MBP5481626.1 sel1 repeat family protein [Paludibacteraceae bacterium]
MDNNILGCTVIIYPDCDESEEKKLERDRIGKEFRTLIWGEDGEGGIAQKLKDIPYEPYGNDLEFILLDFQVTPTAYVRDAIKDVDGYSKKEKSIGVNIIIEEDFFTLSQEEQFNHVKRAILSRLDMLKRTVTRRKLDTDIDKLTSTVDDLLKGPLTSTTHKEPANRVDPPEPIEPICALTPKSKESEEEVAKLIELAEQGDAVALKRVADCYYDGIGIELDLTKAAEWYGKIVEQGDPEVLRRIGFCHYQKREFEKALELWREAAAQGSVVAYRNLGNCYNFGCGVDRNCEKAVELYTIAAEQGDAIAQYNLAYSYHSGEGARKDEAKAAEWYAKAAEQGLAEAQYSLGIRYFKGEGVPVDYEKAAEWCKKAAKQGDKQASSLLRYLRKYKLS